MQRTLAFIICTVLIGCANQAELAKRSITEKVGSGYAVEFRNVTNYPGSVSCGEYKSYDKWGNGGDFRPFLVKGGEVIMPLLVLDIEIFCSSDPASSLFSELGINTSAGFIHILLKIRADFNEIQGALELFYQRNLRYPNTREGLEVLVAPAKYARQPGPLVNGRYLQALPQDPWNRDYIYNLSGLAGVKRDPEVSTLGADAVVGGQDKNADVTLRDIKYLDHIISM